MHVASRARFVQRAPAAPVAQLTFAACARQIVKVVKTITRKKAHRITVQAHSMGTATVTTTYKQMAKQNCMKLQKFGLTSSIAPDGSRGDGPE